MWFVGLDYIVLKYAEATKFVLTLFGNVTSAYGVVYPVMKFEKPLKNHIFVQPIPIYYQVINIS